MLWTFILSTLLTQTPREMIATAHPSPVSFAQEAEPCTNGGFEQVDRRGFAADWGPVGRTVQLTRNARSGQWALELTRTADIPQNLETGLNRTKLIHRVQGGMEFWYKATAADSAQLRIMVIPIGDDGREGTGSPRAEYIVPPHHIGDGQWHLARIRYDYSDNPKVKQVHFAARITGKAGQLLLDDIRYLERTGPILAIGRLRWQEDAQQPGKKAVLSAKLENTGDAPAESIQLILQSPEGLSISASLDPVSPEETPQSRTQTNRPKNQTQKPLSERTQKELGGKEVGFPSASGPSKLMVPTLAPGRSVWVRWTVEGPRTKPGAFTVRAVTGQMEASDRLEIAPQMVLRSFGPTAPVAIAGHPIRVECVVENPGRAILESAEAELQISISGKTEQKKMVLPPVRPGRWESQAVEFTPTAPTESVKLGLELRSAGMAPIEAASEVLVLPDRPLPPPAGRLQAKAADTWAVLENPYLRLIFPRSAGGFGPALLQVRKPAGSAGQPAEQTGPFISVGWLTPLSRLVWQTESGQEESATIFTDQPPQAELLPAQHGPAPPKPASSRTKIAEVAALTPPGPAAAKVVPIPLSQPAPIARLVFCWSKTEAQGTQWEFQAIFSLGPEDRLVQVQYRLQCDRPRKLVHFQGPMFSVLQRREAVFPGLEWLVDDELSSSSLDIAEDHPHRLRRVVHPQMITIPAIGLDTGQGVVGLLWDNRPRTGRPAVVFDSPDRLHHRRTHLVGLFLPPVPDYVEVNQLVARRPYPLEPGKPLHIECQLYADGAARDVLAPLQTWISRYGLPEPTPLPHQNYQQEIAFSMQAYLQSLWDPESQKWWTTKGGGRMSQQGRPAAFVADLLLGELLSPDRALAGACRQRAEEVVRLIGGPARLDAQRFPGRFDLNVANPNHAAHLLAARQQDGTWRFDADYEPTEGPFVGMDYHQLGPDEALEVGTCARKAYVVLRYARIAGDMEVYHQMLPTLQVMERFRVPRAAQVWEIPVHTPDVLAAADAVDAFLEAYWLSGDPRWLADAVLWARRGLPFIYLWEDPEKPFLLGGSIPVFGATWYRGSWFGRPVQWNGLRYAAALLKLAPHDQTLPWRKLATLIVHSAIHQQAPDGPDVALWPDNISAIDSQRCPWVFAPRQIIQCVCELLDRPEEPRTVIVGQGDRRLHLTATGRISQPVWDQNGLQFTITYPEGEQGVVLVSPVGRPEEVRLDGQAVPQRPASERPASVHTALEHSDEPGWRYDAGYAYLCVRIPRSGPVKVEVRPAAHRPISRVPKPADKIAFDFTDSTEGWLPLHQVENFRTAEGLLQGEMTGPDPYIARYLLRVPGRQAPVLRVRLRTTAGRTAQLFWATETSPHFDEQKSIRFPLQSDGQFHEYQLDVGKHPAWRDGLITALRLDPADQPGQFALDYLHASSE